MSQIDAAPSPFHGVDIPSYDVLTNCMHCGLCLPTCPTYALTGLEKSSPRGRIRLIKAVADGDLPITDNFVHEMNFCLDCQACETACPAGVKYGSLVEAARAQIYRGGYEGRISDFIKKTMLEWTFLRQDRLKVLASFMRLYEQTGLKWFLQKTGALRMISSKLDAIQPLSPSISTQFSSDVLPEHIYPAGKPRYRVGFLTGCIMDVAFADVNIDTINLLLHHDCEVIVPRGQACCGSLQAHNGSIDAAREMAKHNIELFDRDDLDFVILNSAGCGAYMKEYSHVFADDHEWSERAHRVSSKTKDITEFLVETGFWPNKSARRVFSLRGTMAPVGPMLGKRISYHDACHLVHTQKISQQPRDLLKAIPGIEYTELPESSWCCGSAGIYNVVHYEDSMKMLDRKIANIATVHPDIIVTGNPGCMLQIQHGLRQKGMNVQLVHTATFLWRACELS
ncbi:MAG: (Fe-S)-binding protein [Ignavibacteriales bacterium]|nr:(Fe-S)-binding protein [Ignavibacteriales bacterium]